MYSTHEAEIDMPMLPLAARHVHMVPALHPHSLMSIGQLCDNGCTVEFDSNSVSIQHNGTTVLRGSRTTDTRLWHIDTTPVTNDTSYNAIIQSAFGAMHESTPETRVAFMHATLGSPALSTLENAIKKNYLISFPSLTVEALRKHPPRSTATSKSHLDQQRKNLRSTKSTTPTATTTTDDTAVDDDLMEMIEDTQPIANEDGHRIHQCYV
jgi:hypothetical protein